MCGIAGILKRGTSDYPIGKSLLSMALCLQHRGADSAGVAVFGASQNQAHLQIALPLGATAGNSFQALSQLGVGRLRDIQPERGGYTAQMGAAFLDAPPTNIEYSKYDGNALDDAAFIHALESGLNGATVSSMGRKMRVYKAVGRVEKLTSEMSAMTGTHGIAHLRLATESRIDPAHAQPFWGRPYADIAVTHNGHITNYHKLRQKFEARGFSFASHNDSEIIGVYLGDKMDAGATLSQALQTASRELDGSFSFIVATANGLGVARDSLATKPLLFVENEDGVCLASEPQALYRVLGDGIRIREIKPRETRTWELE
jgi:glutamine phosphoribosylpyrophosphate amidotransferase